MDNKLINLNATTVAQITDVSNQCGILFDTARLLYVRGIDTPQKAKRFLNPSKKNFNNPNLLNGMSKAVERLTLAKEKSQTVLIFGDYDADGICATTVLHNCLKDFGINSIPVIPEREDGYGLNQNKIAKLKAENHFDLVVTVDCGISDVETINSLKKQNIDVIVTDHHEPPEILPDCVCINPKIKGQDYPFDGLCGAGVAYKLGYSLIGEKANDYLDFVALATVADSMDLVDENRDIVVEGLKLFSDLKIRDCFKNLIGDADKKITASTLAYLVAPRVNAGGRMGDANSALKLFTATDAQEIFEYSVKLNAYNIERQAECDRVYNLAKEQINKYKLYKKGAILVKGDDWNAGVIGIVSARLVEDYTRPVITFALCDGYYKGSARSVEGVNIYELINRSKDLLKTFGGHAQAAGVSVDLDKYDAFESEFISSFENFYGEQELEASERIEWNIDSPISLRFAKEITLLEPFGTGNKKPYFSTTVNSVKAQPLKSGSPHYSFNTNAIQMLNFNGESDLIPLSLNVEKQIVFEINYSVFRNTQSIKGFVKSVVPNYSNLIDLENVIFEQGLKNLTIGERKIEYPDGCKDLPSNQIVVKKGQGKVYVLSDVKNYYKYPELKNLSVSLFEHEAKGCENFLLICPKSLPNAKVVYLDGGSTYLSGDYEYTVANDLHNSDYGSLSTLREDFATAFNVILPYVGMEFESAYSAHQKYAPNIEIKQFIFAFSVFNELGFFYIKNGILNRNTEVKSPLTNSIIYSTICNIQEEL